MARVVVAAWAGAGNVGDELILRALLLELRALALDVTVATVSPRATRRDHRVETTTHLGLAGSLASADGLIFGGGGLVQDASSPWSPVFQLGRPWLAHRRHVPVLALGLGAEPLRWKSSRSLVRRSLQPAVEVVARDQASVRELLAIGLSNVSPGADLALLLPRPVASAEDRIVVSLAPPRTRPSVVPGVLRSSPRDGFRNLVAAGVAEPLDELARNAGLSVRFVSMDPRRDTGLHEAVAARLSVPSDIVEPGPDDVLQEFASSRLVVAARYHAAISGLLAARPVIALGYAPKVRELAGPMAQRSQLLDYSREGLTWLPQVGLRFLGLAAPDTEADLIALRTAAEVNRKALQRFALQLQR